LKEHYDDERKAGKLVSMRGRAWRTTKAIGLGVAAIKRIIQYSNI